MKPKPTRPVGHVARPPTSDEAGPSEKNMLRKITLKSANGTNWVFNNDHESWKQAVHEAENEMLHHTGETGELVELVEEPIATWILLVYATSDGVDHDVYGPFKTYDEAESAVEDLLQDEDDFDYDVLQLKNL